MSKAPSAAFVFESNSAATRLAKAVIAEVSSRRRWSATPPVRERSASTTYSRFIFLASPVLRTLRPPMKDLEFANSLASRLPRKSLSKERTRLAEPSFGMARIPNFAPNALPR